ncbi:MAG: hypothetical protein WCE62_02715, partial [Polyangiales bacterium]
MKQLTTQAVLLTASVLWLTGAGCMTDPGHGETVPSVDSNVQFGGYLEYPDRDVQVLAQPFDYGNPLDWHNVGGARSSTSSITWDGRQW